MRTLKNLWMTAIIAATLFACDENEVSPPPPLPPTDRDFVEGTFDMDAHESFKGDRNGQVFLQITMEGEGELDKLGPAQIRLEHEKIVETRKGGFELINGNFTIWNNSGSNVFGNYTGTFHPDQQTLYHVEAVIKGGAGEFADKYGSLSINFTQLGGEHHKASIEGWVFESSVSKPEL